MDEKNPGSVPLSGSTPKANGVFSGLNRPQSKFGGNYFNNFCVILFTSQHTNK